VNPQGYALVSAALNFKNQHSKVHQLAKLAMDRLKQQESILGGRYNDWYHYGKASCSYMIPMLSKHDKCIEIPDIEIELFNDYQMVKTGHCNPASAKPNQQWIYNRISWQIVPRFNQSQCLQKLFDGYNNGTPIVLKECHRHKSQVSIF
jgi:hypothetical protein